MKTIQFKTTIKCAACIAKVSETLNSVVGEGKWVVDTQNPSKILSIDSETDPLKISQALEKIGYKAEPIS